MRLFLLEEELNIFSRKDEALIKSQFAGVQK
jgi:hypothetical protein